MIGHIEFNSACYYRYANLDTDQLLRNLQGDGELALQVVRAFLTASRDAIPTGKQNSFAAHNPPAFLFTVVRNRGAWSLANAFARPVRPSSGEGLIEASVAALDQHWRDLTSVYGRPEGLRLAACSVGEPRLDALAEARVSNFDELVDRTLGALAPSLGA
jgi:CRISPR system Cascade subunit CasC